ncbi:MAG: alpha-amylase family glycosyl hydrolase [Rubrivivax sp.]|nr:alpha-amylase family glycosyl hydrolase [Rubrivivax sp.]
MLAVAGALCAGPLPAAGPALKLHIPSPGWRDQVLYFVMTDRFADGDPRNNDQGAGEYRPGDNSRYQGGDLAGLVRRLDYIRGLGVTGVWITPPVANQWLAPAGTSAGYHGYWAQHFMQVDPHLGSLDDYRRLSDALHRRGMTLVQDIVLNHTGNYFGYGAEWSAADPTRGFLPHTATPPVPRPTQPPFHLNDPRDPVALQAGIYHWTPDVRDYNDAVQERTFQMSGLDDLNTANPAVRRALRRSYGHWIHEVGVDAFRVDTAFYVSPDDFADFLRARDAQAPGVLEVARRTGRRNFHVFGEGFGIDRPGDDTQALKIERYMRGPRGEQLLPGMLNFPLYGAIGDAFARGRPSAELGARITRMMQVHRRPHLMPSFVDNHDVDRFLAGGGVDGLKQALLALMTLPGIPVVYYGTEQGFTAQRASMFAAGAGSGGRDHYDMQAPLYRTVAELTALRRTHRVLSRGMPTVLHGNAARPGALAWRMDHRAGRAGPGSAFVVFNTADGDSLLPALDTGLAPGTVLRGLHGLHGRPPDLVVAEGGRLSLRLAARSGQVWVAGAQRAAVPPSSARIAVDAGAAGAAAAVGRHAGDFTVGGTARGVSALQLVVDGDLSRAVTVTPDADGRWQAVVDTGAMVDPDIAHNLVAWAEGAAVSAVRHFRVDRPWQTVVDQPDPAGDDHGPDGLTTYPTDPGWGTARQMDLQHVRVETAGGALRLVLTMNQISTTWNPPNGFDHAAFTIYIELPGRDGGATEMPLQHGTLPGGMRWHLRLRAGGWSNALHAHAGASAEVEGTPVTPGATLAVDGAARTVSFTLPAAALGRLPSLRGARLYVTTWDYDGGYRALGPVAGPYSMGGGAADGLRVMDDSGVITLP